MSSQKVLMAQLEIKSGDIKGNTAKIIDVIVNNRQYDLPESNFQPAMYCPEPQPKAKFIVFAELATSGYNCGALFENAEFIDANYNAILEIASHVGDEVVLVGAPRFGNPRRKKNGNLKLHNSVFVLHQGKIVGVYDKIHLANDFQHEDRKYFYAGTKTYMNTIHGVNFGILICEDIWRDDHTRDLLAEMKTENPGLETVFCLNYSYYTYEKQTFRENLLSSQAKNNNVSIFYLNALGVGDIVKNIIAYDGASLAYNSKGERMGTLKPFEEDIRSFDIDGEPEIGAFLPKNVKYRDYQWTKKYASLWSAQQYVLPKVWAASGLEKVFVSVSGGVDSAIVATLAAKTMGVDKCVFVSMPSQYNGSITKNAAQHLADKLGVKLLWTPIGDSESAVLESIDRAVNPEGTTPITNSLVTSTVDATLRSVIALAMCHQYKAGILATGNHTENILGWCTFHDVGSIGVYQPIGDLTKTELFELCEYINWFYEEEIIPEGLWNQTLSSAEKIAPMAELADSKEDPFDYYVMSGICAELIRHRKTQKQIIADYRSKQLTADYFPRQLKCANSRWEHWNTIYEHCNEQTFIENVKEAYRRSKISVFKSAQHAPCLIISPRSRGFSSRETIFNFYKETE